MIDASVRLRFGGSKVRSGCITCKTRHVKCDESLPSCQRCIKGRRDCGYGPLGKGERHPKGELRIIHYVVKVLKSPKSFPDWTSAEKRSLHFFQSRTSIELAGRMISELWSTCILQVASCQPAVKHAVIAMGALHEGFQLHPHAPNTDFATQQYSRAIRAVSRLDLNNVGEVVDVVLLSCMLFTAFENLRGHHKSALTHISSGIKIALAQEAEDGNFQEKHPSWHLLKPVFLFMEGQAMRVGNQVPPPIGKASVRRLYLPLPKAFASIEEARLLLLYAPKHSLRLHLTYEGQRNPNGTDDTTENVQAEEVELGNYYQYFRQWCTIFDQAKFSPSHPEVLILQMYRTVIDLIKGLTPGLEETKWDASHAYCSRIVELGEAFMLQCDTNPETMMLLPESNSPKPSERVQTDDDFDRTENSVDENGLLDNAKPIHDTAFRSELISATSTHSKLQRLSIKPTFTFSHGIIMPLYLVCIRCRDPAIRRRALHILQICNRKEGLWDSARFAIVAERVIQIEETQAGRVVTDASQVPGWARVQQVDTFLGPGDYGKIAYTMSTPSESARVVEYLDGGPRSPGLEEGEEEMVCRSLPRNSLVQS